MTHVAPADECVCVLFVRNDSCTDNTYVQAVGGINSRACFVGTRYVNRFKYK